MREEAGGKEPSWFARWEEELPTPEELMPLSQTLITPDLALAFDIPTHTSNHNHNHNHTNSNSAPLPPTSSSLHHHLPPPSDFDSADLGSSGGGGGGGGATNCGDEPARTLKRPRLVWTPQLHKRFVDAVAHLGIKNAVPKTIMQLMSVDGLTRENVASHLQKYRLYLKRMQGLSSAGGGGAGGGSAGPISAADDQLFSSGPIPHHFLNRGGGGPGPEPFVPFVPMAALQQHHHQMAAAAAAAAVQQQFYHQRQIGHFGSVAAAAGNGGAGGGGFDHGFLSRTPPPAGLHRMGPGGLHSIVQPVAQGPTTASYVDDLEERSGNGGRKVLTLFPTGED